MISTQGFRLQSWLMSTANTLLRPFIVLLHVQEHKMQVWYLQVEQEQDMSWISMDAPDVDENR